MVTFEDMLAYCSANEYSREATSERRVKLLAIMRNLKEQCENKKINLRLKLSEIDRGRTGKVPFLDFINLLKKEDLIEDPVARSTLANGFVQRFSNMVNIDQLNIDIESLDVKSTGPIKDLLTSQIVKHAVELKMSLLDIFDKYSASRQMDLAKFKELVKALGETSMSAESIETLFNELDKKATRTISIYQFLSIFDRQTVQGQIAYKFKDHVNLYNTLKAFMDKQKSTISAKFANVTHTSILIQEIEKIKPIADEKSKFNISGFADLLEAINSQKMVDHFGLKLLEESVGNANLGSLLPQLISQDPSIEAESGVTYVEVKKIKKAIASLDKMVKEGNSDYKTMLKKYDPNNSGLVSDTDFE